MELHDQVGRFVNPALREGRQRAKKTYESTLSPVTEPAVEVCDAACGGVDPRRVKHTRVNAVKKRDQLCPRSAYLRDLDTVQKGELVAQMVKVEGQREGKEKHVRERGKIR